MVNCPLCDRSNCKRPYCMCDPDEYCRVRQSCDENRVDWRARYLEDQRRVRVGVAVAIRKGSAVLIGQRRGGRGHGTWALPGGHLEYKESIVDCAVREVFEETGLSLIGVTQGPYVNNIFGEDGRHYITLFVQADLAQFNEEPKVMEPEKCSEWRWCSQNSQIPVPRFPPFINFLNVHDLFKRW